MAGLQLVEPLSALAGSGVTATATSAAQNHTADLITLSVLIADLLSALSASYTICAKAARRSLLRDVGLLTTVELSCRRTGGQLAPPAQATRPDDTAARVGQVPGASAGHQAFLGSRRFRTLGSYRQRNVRVPPDVARGVPARRGFDDGRSRRSARSPSHAQ